MAPSHRGLEATPIGARTPPEEEAAMASPRSPMHQRRRLSRDSQRRDPHSPQERKEQQRAANVRWMREWQPVDPRMATVFLTWKRDVWGTRCITAHMVRTYRNARARNALYVALRQWLGSTCVGNAHREPSLFHTRPVVR